MGTGLLIVMDRPLTVRNQKGRRACNFTVTGPNSCLDGGCNGGLQCDKTTGTVRNLFDLLALLGEFTTCLVGCPSGNPCRIFT